MSSSSTHLSLYFFFGWSLTFLVWFGLVRDLIPHKISFSTRRNGAILPNLRNILIMHCLN